MNIAVILLCLCIVSPLILWGQADSTVTQSDTLKLNTVTVLDSNMQCGVRGIKQIITFGTFNYYDNIDIRRVYSLTQLLERSNGIAIRSYSPGGLATVAYRGTASAQTSFLWNELPIISTQNGLFDASLMPAYLFDQADINASAHEIGAEVKVHSLAITASEDRNKILNIRASMGSFGWQEQALKGTLKEDRLISSFRMIRQRAVNNYSYYNAFTSRIEKQVNAQFGLQAAVLTLHLNLSGLDSVRKKSNTHHYFNLSAWVQDAERQIPPTLLTALSDARQQDRSIRLAFSYNNRCRKNSFKVYGGINNDYLLYVDTLAKINAPYNNRILVGNLYYTFNFKDDQSTALKINFLNQLQTATAEAYQTEKIRFLTAPEIQFKHRFRNVRDIKSLEMFVKHQFVSDRKGLWNYGASLYQSFRLYSITLSANRAFRLPTFNDLYWIPGGNPNLKPEKSWNSELSVQKLWWTIKDNSVLIRANVYAKLIEDGIIWLPTGGFWSPINISTLWARGIESKVTIKKQIIKNINIRSELSYDHCRSTPIKTVLPNDASLHKQVMYVPIHQAQGSIEIIYRSLSLRFRHQYTGIRYTVTDESDFLPSFSLGELSLEKQFVFQKIWLKRVVLRMDIQNLYDSYFEAVVLRPQPGRQFRFSLDLDW